LQNEAKLLTVLPNTLQLDDWAQPTNAHRKHDQSVRFLFAGNLGRYGDLMEVKDAFEYAMNKHANMRLFFVNCLPDWAAQWMDSADDPAKNRVFRINRCDVATYRATLQWLAPDVIFSPVTRNKFNASKSHIKAYDAAMCNAAFLCSDWTTHDHIPNDAAIKVDGDYEWREAIDALMEDSKLRTRLSARLLQWADHWKVDNHLTKWLKLYETVLSKGPARSLDDIVRPEASHGVPDDNSSESNVTNQSAAGLRS
jgi:hypothetical protein